MDNTTWIIQDDPNYKEDNFTMHSGSSEMLRVARDGFYVRGVRIEQDEKEAEKVYNAFKQWLTWATLTRDYNT